MRLTRGEYWLLETVVQEYCPLCFLNPEAYDTPDGIELMFNKPGHGLSGLDLIETLSRLSAGGTLMSEVLHGVVHGKTIELERSPQVGEGQAVEVVLRPIAPPEHWGEGLRRCAGALADDPEIDGILEDIRRERKMAKFREIVE